MTSYPTINNGDTLDGPTLTAAFQNLMAVNLAHGKGVVDGLSISSGGTDIVHITTGSFVSQAQDSVTTAFDVTIGSSVAGYLWIEADDSSTATPTTELTTTFVDPGSLWVCLGHVVSDGSGVVTVDMNDGRQVIGGDSFLSNVTTALARAFGGTLTAAKGFGSTAITVAGSNITLNATQSAAETLFLSGTPGATRNVIAPAYAGKGYDVVNRTDSSVLVKTASGSGVTIATLKAARVVCDGTDIVRLTADA